MDISPYIARCASRVAAEKGDPARYIENFVEAAMQCLCRRIQRKEARSWKASLGVLRRSRALSIFQPRAQEPDLTLFWAPPPGSLSTRQVVIVGGLPRAAQGRSACSFITGFDLPASTALACYLGAGAEPVPDQLVRGIQDIMRYLQRNLGVLAS